MLDVVHLRMRWSKAFQRSFFGTFAWRQSTGGRGGGGGTLRNGHRRWTCVEVIEGAGASRYRTYQSYRAIIALPQQQPEWCCSEVAVNPVALCSQRERTCRSEQQLLVCIGHHPLARTHGPPSSCTQASGYQNAAATHHAYVYRGCLRSAARAPSAQRRHTVSATTAAGVMADQPSIRAAHANAGLETLTDDVGIPVHTKGGGGGGGGRDAR